MPLIGWLVQAPTVGGSCQARVEVRVSWTQFTGTSSSGPELDHYVRF